ISKEYFARPDTLCGPSILDTRFPIKVRLSASGHLYSAIALPSFRGSLLYCRSDTHVGSAAAQVAAEASLDLFGRRIGVLVEERLAGHNEARCAEAALLSIVVDECLLNRMQLVALHQIFNGADRFALCLDRQNRARVDRSSVDDHCASAAGCSIAYPL